MDRCGVFVPPDATEDQLAAIAGALANVTNGDACERDWETLKPCYFYHGPEYRPEGDVCLLTVCNRPHYR